MSTTISVRIERNLDPNPDSGVFRRQARNTATGATVIINYVDAAGTSRYTTNGTPTASLRLSDADYHRIWGCPVPSEGDHRLTYDETKVIQPGVYKVTAYQHCSGIIVFP